MRTPILPAILALLLVVLVPHQPDAPAPLALSDVARALQHDPAALDDLLNRLAASAGEFGGAVDTPRRRAELRRALIEIDVAVLDHFPTLTPADAAAAAVLYASLQGPLRESSPPARTSLILTHSPATPPADLYVHALGHGLFHGDETRQQLAAPWADSQTIAAALNVLASNDPAAPAHSVSDEGRTFTGVGAWLQSLVDDSHTIEVDDRRMYANFGDLRFEHGGVRRDVMTPMFVDTGLVTEDGTPVVVPMTHSELDVTIAGRRVNAELSFYFGADGSATFRALDTVDQGWVGGRTVRAYRGIDAVQLLGRAAWVRQRLMEKAAAHRLPLGGYGALGTCNDVDAMITGDLPYGMLRDRRYFDGTSPFDRLSRTLPFDATDPPTIERIWASRAFDHPEDIPLRDVRAVMRELEIVSNGPASAAGPARR